MPADGSVATGTHDARRARRELIAIAQSAALGGQQTTTVPVANGPFAAAGARVLAGPAAVPAAPPDPAAHPGAARSSGPLAVIFGPPPRSSTTTGNACLLTERRNTSPRAALTPGRFIRAWGLQVRRSGDSAAPAAAEGVGCQAGARPEAKDAVIMNFGCCLDRDTR
jgi:hypothetical protein